MGLPAIAYHRFTPHMGVTKGIQETQKHRDNAKKRTQAQFFALQESQKWPKDYYPFGLEITPRSSANSDTDNSFGFNGKMRDDKFGTITNYDYGFRIYNPAMGRFLSVDPLFKSYPSWSPYPFAMNRPIDGVDLDGLEYYDADDAMYNISRGQTWLKKETFIDLYGRQLAQQIEGSIRQDGFGQDYIGATVPIQKVEFPDDLPKTPTMYSLSMAKNMLSLASAQRGLHEIEDKRSPSTPGYRPSSRVSKSHKRGVYQRSARTLKGMSGGGIALTLVDLSMQVHGSIKSTRSFFGGSEQFRDIQRSWDAVNKAKNSGMIKNRYQNIESESQLADYIYQGTPIQDRELQRLAIDISKRIAKNFRYGLESVESQSGLDNFPSQTQYFQEVDFEGVDNPDDEADAKTKNP